MTISKAAIFCVSFVAVFAVAQTYNPPVGPTGPGGFGNFLCEVPGPDGGMQSVWIEDDSESTTLTMNGKTVRMIRNVEMTTPAVHAAAFTAGETTVSSALSSDGTLDLFAFSPNGPVALSGTCLPR